MPKITVPPIFNVSEIARQMFPNNSQASLYLYRKLNETDGRKLTIKEKKKIAEMVLKEAKDFSENILK